MNKEYTKSPLCVFCEGENKFLYKMGEYNILRCSNCGTGSIDPLPSQQQLLEKYDGFLGELDRHPLVNVEYAAEKMFEGLCFPRGQDLKMLDIGGGGGFFSKAFAKR